MDRGRFFGGSGRIFSHTEDLILVRGAGFVVGRGGRRDRGSRSRVLEMKVWKNYLSLAIIACASFFISHWPLYSLAEIADWVFCREMSGLALGLNLVVHAGFALALQCLVQNWVIAGVATCTGSLILGFVNMIKVSQTGFPILPHDLLLLKHIGLLAAYLKPYWLPIALGAAGFLGVVGLGVLAARPRQGKDWLRSPGLFLAIHLSICLVVMLGLAFQRKIHLDRRLWPLGVADYAWNQVANCRKNGPAVSFLNSLGYLDVAKPRNTSATRIRKILNGCDDFPAAPPPHPGKPDIVVLLLESFWDVTELGKDVFSEDPIPNFRRMLSSSAVPRFFSPVFGGNTANVEFELLTGISMGFLPRGSVPYEHYIKNDVPTVLTDLLAEGYQTIAVHNYTRTFWRRHEVYPRVGFQKFYSLEDLEANPMVSVQRGPGNLPKDEILFDKLEGLLAEPGDAPKFLFAINVSTHGPYDYQNTFPHVVHANVPDDPYLKNVLENHASGIHHVDQLLGQFMEKIARRGRDTLVFAFGDHRPGYGLDYYGYRRFGLAPTPTYDNWPRPSQIQLYTTPMVIYRNRPVDLAQLRLNRSQDILGANCLGAQMLHMSGLRASPFFSYLKRFCMATPFLMPMTGEDDCEKYEDYFTLSFHRLFEKPLLAARALTARRASWLR